MRPAPGGGTYCSTGVYECYYYETGDETSPYYYEKTLDGTCYMRQSLSTCPPECRRCVYQEGK